MCELKFHPRHIHYTKGSHTLTGVWVEIFGCYRYITKYISHTLTGVWVEIVLNFIISPFSSSHTLTGVWVEMGTTALTWTRQSHTLTGVWVEIVFATVGVDFGGRHTLTGVWVEIFFRWTNIFCRLVTPSRVCELKWQYLSKYIHICKSHPHGCVSWNHGIHLLTANMFVTPSRVCELKCMRQCYNYTADMSHPHGCVSWNARNVR